MSELQREIDRSRRHGHRFVLVRVAPAGTDIRELTRSLTASLRRTDRWWLEGGAAFVLAPESTPARAEALVGRLRDSLSLRTALDVVAFPDDGLTARALLAALHHGTNGSAPSRSRERERASITPSSTPSSNGHTPGWAGSAR